MIQIQSQSFRRLAVAAAAAVLTLAPAFAQTQAVAPGTPPEAAHQQAVPPPPTPMRSWAQYWKAVRARQIASEPDARVMIKRFTHPTALAHPDGGPVGNQTFAPYFSGSDTTISFYDYSQWAGLVRQSNCSLSELIVGNPNQTPGQYETMQTIPDYERYLHTISGLTTTVDKFPNGCDDPGTPLTMQQFVYAGKTSAGDYIGPNFGFADPSIFYVPVVSTSTLVSEKTYSPGNNISGMLAADFNGDGKLDLAIADTSDAQGLMPQISIMLGNGDGTFQSPTQITGYNILGVVAGDFNGDGKIDLVATVEKTSTDYQLLFFAGKGTGSFAAPVVTDTGTVEKLVTLPVHLTSGGALDIVAEDVAVSGSSYTTTLDLLENNGSASFTSKLSSFTSGYLSTVSAGDLNNDGKLDLVINSFTGNSLSVLKGNGDGTFTLQYVYPTLFMPTASAIADLDGDGNADIWVGYSAAGVFGSLFGAGGAGQALLGHGDFTLSTPSLLQPLNSTTAFSQSAQSIAVSDFNGDGKQDVAAAGRNTSTSATIVDTFLGNGTSTPSNGTSVPFTVTTGTTSAGGLLAAPLSGTTPIDLIVAGTDPSNSAGAIQTAINNGSDSFTVKSVLDLPAPVASFVAADFNADGKTDLALILNDGGLDAADALYIALGNGDGTFKTPTILSSAVTFGGTVVTADLNKDGKPDLVVIPESDDYTSPNALVYLNKGGGTFSSPTTLASPDNGNFTDVIAADFTGDGKIDLVLLGGPDPFAPNAYLYTGNGSGGFTYTSNSALGFNPVQNGIAVDVNQDGILDLVVNGCCGLATPSLALGKGDGTFYPAQPFNSITSAASISAINLNGDKYPDLVFLLANGTTGQVAPVINHYANAPSVTKAATTVTIEPPVSVTQSFPLYLYATVSENSAAGQPGGTVTVSSGSNVLQTVELSEGQAYFDIPTTGIPPGKYTLTVAYSGDNFNQPSSASVPLNIQYLTATTLTVNPAAIDYDGTVTLTSKVSRTLSSGTPTGSVDIYYNAGNTFLTSIPLVNGVATLKTSVKGYPAGQYVLSAFYDGEDGSAGADVPSSSPNVNTSIAPQGLIATTTTLSVSPDPITYGQTATLSATVAPGTGSTVPTGNVTFYALFYGTTYNLGTVALSKGVATVHANTSNFGYYGYFTAYAIYAGNSTTYRSDSTDLSVYLREPSYVYFPVNQYTVTAGQSVTLAAEVPQESSYPVNGTLTFSAEGVKLATVQVTNNQASFTASTAGLAKGKYTVTATYNGDQYNGIGSGTATVTIQ